MNRTKNFAAIGAAVLFSISLAACSSAEPAATTSATSTAPMTSPMESPMESPMASPMESMDAMNADAPFGPGCSAVPADGAGSFDGMSKDPVATAASNNEDLSTLVTAVKAADLVDTLNNKEDITVFAPSNSAFAAMDQTTLEAALADPSGLLTTVLTAHVVDKRIAPADLPGVFDTLNGTEKITVEGSGEDFTVNGTAKIVCGNVQTSNATVYIIDGVLLPQG
ncbi:fasciclin domain-containing protein [Tessaracoccus antarcticus]|uniref:Fasciclin domain-containing protein n=1 Tax=Tessaracoccus antarcticus TaxID=2479848 RepID=A0A3M0GB81_9ACTN|nr:fasciclin domain-containing protein [Tessaracoccus antarcticus]RMB58833.1 fasciclin domain-containing protein [Tessaracoccus antarcticus]